MYSLCNAFRLKQSDKQNNSSITNYFGPHTRPPQTLVLYDLTAFFFFCVTTFSLVIYDFPLTYKTVLDVNAFKLEFDD